MSLPPVSIVIPTFNEEGFIDQCLQSLLSGSYPAELLEILVVDGGSEDKTRDQILEIAKQHPSIRILENKKKIVPAAVNLGVAQAQHDIILWLGAHAKYDHDYITNSVRCLTSNHCVGVGGVISPLGITDTGKAIARATMSRFGIGNAKYRLAKSKQVVETLFGGCWYKDTFLEVGGFDESWVRNQDFEFNYRLRKQGDLILDPSIKCQYFCRNSLSGLTRQYFQYGFWRIQTMLRYPNSIMLRQLAPIGLVVVLFFSVILLLFKSSTGLLVPVAYSLGILAASILASSREGGAKQFFLLLIIFPILHLAWGVGAIWGLITRLFRSNLRNK